LDGIGFGLGKKQRQRAYDEANGQHSSELSIQNRDWQ
jgi:hypothetical protein